jgi:hypothetical protein
MNLSAEVSPCVRDVPRARAIRTTLMDAARTALRRLSPLGRGGHVRASDHWRRSFGGAVRGPRPSGRANQGCVNFHDHGLRNALDAAVAEARMASADSRSVRREEEPRCARDRAAHAAGSLSGIAWSTLSMLFVSVNSETAEPLWARGIFTDGRARSDRWRHVCRVRVALRRGQQKSRTRDPARCIRKFTNTSEFMKQAPRTPASGPRRLGAKAGEGQEGSVGSSPVGWSRRTKASGRFPRLRSAEPRMKPKTVGAARQEGGAMRQTAQGERWRASTTSSHRNRLSSTRRDVRGSRRGHRHVRRRGRRVRRLRRPAGSRRTCGPPGRT